MKSTTTSITGVSALLAIVFCSHTALADDSTSLVHPGPALVNPGPSLVHPGPSLINPGPSLVHPGPSLIHPVRLLGNGISLLEEGKCNHHLMVGTDTLFAFDKADLSAAAQTTLTKLGALIKKYGSHPVTVEGHTDGKGSDDYNQPLSERRAQAVKDWLVAHSYISPQTKAIGFGKKKPVASNTKPDGSDNPAGRQLNRRVEVVVDTCH